MREAQAAIDQAALPVATDATGDARVVAASVAYDRQGQPSGAPVIAELAGGRRAAARATPAALEKLGGRNLVGETVRIDGSTYEI
jgi:hypothetical protein